MKRLIFLFLLAVVSLCHAPPAMAHLHPNLQWFVQRDPLGYADRLSLYEYERSASVSLRDPSGHKPGQIGPRTGTCRKDVTKDCPPEARTAKPDAPKVVLNGCGPNWLPFVPDSPFGYRFHQSCNGHDQCYQTCGESKKSCDDGFQADMEIACHDMLMYGEISEVAYQSCLNMARIYAGAVRLLGGDSYHSSQNEQCECPGNAGGR